MVSLLNTHALLITLFKNIYSIFTARALAFRELIAGSSWTERMQPTFKGASFLVEYADTPTNIFRESERLNANKFLESRPRHGASVLWEGTVGHCGAAARDNRNICSTHAV